MATRSSVVHIRIDDDLKTRANEALGAMGLTMSDAVRLLLLHRVVIEQALPLELKVPNAETRTAMFEANQIVRGRPARFSTSVAMFEALDTRAGR